jgi:Glyoxalase superfamily protein/ClpX C4-type zinc finger
MPTSKDAKAMAKSLRAALAERNVSLSHGECLEIIARQLGVADWNTLTAKMLAEEQRLARSERTDAATPQQSCSFCGRAQPAIRRLFEGGCARHPGAAHGCVFICTECVAFCAQIDSDRAREAVAIE